MKLTKSLMVAAVAGIALLATSCGGGGGQQGGGLITVTFAGTEAPATGQSRAMQEMADILNATGRFNAVVQVGGALSNDTDNLVTQARTGVPLVVPTDPGRLATQFNIPDMNILMAPFVLTDPEVLPRLVQTPLFNEWQNQLEQQGVIFVANMYNGFRSFYTVNPVNTVSDLSGLRIRGFGNDIGNALGRHLGFANIGIAWGETLPGLQQGTLDGTEVQVAAAYGSAIFDVANYLALTRHFMLQSSFVVSSGLLNSMPAEDREFFLTTVREVAARFSDIIAEEEIDYYQRMAARGVTIVEVNMDEFMDAIAPLYIYNDLGFSPGLRDRLFAELDI
ncbi:MAG: TRAP transporter substrate-binding protein DctP [Spirochaetes bacterium]|nr:TRAP transporter substrate-binding protein DctP [Spirochaetota bacterium]